MGTVYGIKLGAIKGGLTFTTSRGILTNKSSAIFTPFLK